MYMRLVYKYQILCTSWKYIFYSNNYVYYTEFRSKSFYKKLYDSSSLSSLIDPLYKHTITLRTRYLYLLTLFLLFIIIIIIFCDYILHKLSGWNFRIYENSLITMKRIPIILFPSLKIYNILYCVPYSMQMILGMFKVNKLI